MIGRVRDIPVPDSRWRRRGWGFEAEQRRRNEASLPLSAASPWLSTVEERLIPAVPSQTDCQTTREPVRVSITGMAVAR